MVIVLWEDVLTDYSSGMVVCYAKDVGEAFIMANKEYPDEPFGEPTKVIDCETDTDSCVMSVYGGG